MPEPIPNREQYHIKKDFEERYRSLLGKDYCKFMDYSLSFLRRSIRVNTLKIKVNDLIKRMPDWTFKQIPWCKEGFWVEHKEGRRDIGNALEYKLGYFYVQEAASMIPPVVLGPKNGELVLDLCASPGSKTTQIAQYMQNNGLLIANDVKGDKMKPLGLNIQRMGISNCIITMMQGQWFNNISFKFDRVLVDAPCSGTGTIRKSLKTLRIYNTNMFPKLAKAQKQLIEVGFDILKKGGTLVYSTCSTEPEENEGVISHLLNNNKDAKIQEIKLEINRSTPILEFKSEKYHKGVSKCLRIWPHDNDTEGFFIAKIKKELKYL